MVTMRQQNDEQQQQHITRCSLPPIGDLSDARASGAIVDESMTEEETVRYIPIGQHDYVTAQVLNNQTTELAIKGVSSYEMVSLGSGSRSVKYDASEADYNQLSPVPAVCIVADNGQLSTSQAPPCHVCQHLSACDYAILIICSLLLAVTAVPFGILALIWTLRWRQALKSKSGKDTSQRARREATECIRAGVVCVSVVFVGLVTLLLVLAFIHSHLPQQLTSRVKVTRVDFAANEMDQVYSDRYLINQSITSNSSSSSSTRNDVNAGGSNNFAAEFFARRFSQQALAGGLAPLGSDSSRIAWQGLLKSRLVGGGGQSRPSPSVSTSSIEDVRHMPALLTGSESGDDARSEIDVEEAWPPHQTQHPREEIDRLTSVTPK